MKQGGKVTYDLIQGPKGQLAQNICPLDASGNPRSSSSQQQAAVNGLPVAAN